MKQSKFHVGDWVHVVKKLDNRIRDEYVSKIKYKATGTYETEVGVCTFGEALPISITPETLEMFGFKKVPAPHLFYRLEGVIDGEDVAILACKDDSYCCCVNKHLMDYECNNGNASNTRVRYIHEIQHCMECAGIEKELELYPKKGL